MSNADNLFETAITADEKELFVTLNQNEYGMYLKFSAKARNSRSAVTFPISGAAELAAAITKAAQIASQTAPRPVKTRPVREARPERSADELARTVYISRLAWETTSDGLSAHFKKAGTIVNATLNTRTRRGEVVSVGTATVEYKTPAEAQRAIAELNESELDGRIIRVRGDRSLEEGGAPETREPRARRAKKEKEVNATAAPAAAKAPRARREPVDFSDSVVDPKKVYVRSLSWDTTADDLSNVFSAVGTVTNVEVINRKDGRSSGCAVVEFADASDATEAIERLNGRSLDGREMAVKVCYVK